MNEVMKRIAILFLVLAAVARAEWKDIKEGLDPVTVEQCVGAPLFGNRSRGGTFVSWIYDNGGFVYFENGRVRFWQSPAIKGESGPSVAASAVTAAPSVAETAKASAGSSAAANPATHGNMTLRW